MTKTNKIEKHVLFVSLIGTLFSAIFGIVMGIILQSSFVLFDGVYNFLGVFVSIITIRIGNYLTKKDRKRFPFGKAKLVPLVVLIQNLVILFTITYVLFESISIIVNGGSQLEELKGTVIYLAFSALISLVGYVYLKNKHTEFETIFSITEVEQWRITTILSVGSFIGYLIAQVLVLFNVPYIVYYVDPVMLSLLAIAILRFPIYEIIESTKELIEMQNPNDQTNKRIRKDVLVIAKKYLALETFVRVAKSGKNYYIEIDFVVPEEYIYDSIHDQDIIREEIKKSLKWLKYDKWLTVSFTNQRKWAID